MEKIVTTGLFFYMFAIMRLSYCHWDKSFIFKVITIPAPVSFVVVARCACRTCSFDMEDTIFGGLFAGFLLFFMCWIEKYSDCFKKDIEG